MDFQHFNTTKLKYYNIISDNLEGIVSPDLPRNHASQRLPQKFENKIREEVWELSENSAGVSTSFKSDTSSLTINWSVKHDLRMNHMADAGIKGVDLYQQKNDGWYFVGTGLPNGKENEQSFFNGLSKKMRRYRLHLPLYDTITNIQIGIDDDSDLEYYKNKKRPIVFYGTSITQGGCASRPGLAYTNIISRELGQECINLGFSGNGHLEGSIAKILSNIDAEMYVIECMANIDEKIVSNNTIPLIKMIRRNGSTVPIVFFEQCIIDPDSLHKNVISLIKEKNIELNKQVDDAIDQGEKNIYVIKQPGCIDEDTEATVDGIHFNDLGFQRYAKHFITKVNELNII